MFKLTGKEWDKCRFVPNQLWLRIPSFQNEVMDHCVSALRLGAT